MGRINTLLSLDGEAEFRHQLNLINANLKTLDAELKATSSEFTTESGKMQQNTKMLANLSQQLEFLRAKESILTDAVAKSGQAIENNNTKLNAARQAHDKASRNLEVYKNVMEGMTKAFGADSESVQLLKKQVAELESEEKKAAAEVQKSEKAVDRASLAHQKYKQQLADTRTQINQTEQAERNCAVTLKDVSNQSAIAEKATQALKIGMSALKLGFEATTTTVSALGKALTQAASVEMKAFEASVKAVTEEVRIASEGFVKYLEALAEVTKQVGMFAYNSGASFEASMSKVQAYSQASSEDMEKLAQAAKDAGATTSKTASQAADALGYLALNGYKTDQMLTSLLPVVHASEAGNMDLARTADLTSTSLKAFGRSIDETEEFLNILVATQNNSATGLEDLLGAYTNAGAMFKTLNVGMEESASLLGILANRGFKGTEVGNNLNSILVNLIGANQNAADAMDVLGVSAWDSQGNFRGLTTVLKELGTALDAGTDEDRALIESKIGGKRQFKTLEALIAGVSDEYDHLYEVTSKAYEQDVLTSTSEIMLDNLKGSITLFKSAMESLGIAMFDTFGKQLNDNVKKATEWVTMLKKGIENGNIEGAITRVFNRADKVVQFNIAYISRKMPRYLSIINRVVITGAEKTLKQADKAIELWIPKLFQGFTELTTGIVKLLPEAAKVLTKGAKTYYSGLIKALQETAKELLKVLPEITETISDFLGDNLAELYLAGLDILIELARGVSDNLPTLVSAAVEIVHKLCEGINERIDEIIEIGGDILEELINGIILVLPDLLYTGFKILQSLADYIDDNIDELLRAGEIIISEIGTAVAENLPDLLETALGIVMQIADYLCEDDNLTELVRGAIEILAQLAKFLAEHIDEVVDKIPDLVDAISQAFIDNADVLVDAGVALGEALLKGFWAALKGLEKTETHLKANLLGGFMNGVEDTVVGAIAKTQGVDPDALNSTIDALQATLRRSSAEYDAERPASSSKTDVTLTGDIYINDAERDIPDLIEMTAAALDAAEKGKGR